MVPPLWQAEKRQNQHQWGVVRAHHTDYHAGMPQHALPSIIYAAAFVISLKDEESSRTKRKEQRTM
jgi:hypothetical protein